MIRDIGRFAPKLTEEQRAAVLRAMEYGASAEAAARYAAAGQLAGVEPFDLSATACKELRGEATRRKRERKRAARAPLEGHRPQAQPHRQGPAGLQGAGGQA